MAKDASLTRFNIRTTEQEAKQVKEKILEAFGPTLDKGADGGGSREADRRTTRGSSVQGYDLR